MTLNPPKTNGHLQLLNMRIALTIFVRTDGNEGVRKADFFKAKGSSTVIHCTRNLWWPHTNDPAGGKIDFASNLNDCHNAALWLREKNPEAYSGYVLSVEQWMYSPPAKGNPERLLLIDAPPEIRAAALAEAVRTKITRNKC